ncbi:M17 family metallopeptidase [Sediminibacillus halophilus]|uniref:Probable cytosol aminopeptidase n=1 Tax=Sediminibacillus halophilus TaxID=482461 RepID=A0A1G9UBG0_9BACI|nr:leucyl aminopeptidase family protein [Sediminibacillus halophilus]SDM56865.1 leucyl aminopeptidase [Sediminibacillus halophilus]
MYVRIEPINQETSSIAYLRSLSFGETRWLQKEDDVFLYAAIHKSEVMLEDLRFLGGTINQELQQNRCTKADLDFPVFTSLLPAFSEEEVVAAFMEGWFLADYQFISYKKEAVRKTPKLHFANSDYEPLIKTAITKAEAVHVARDLCNEPANKLTPSIYADKLQKLFKDTAVDVEIIDSTALRSRGFEATAVVGKGSSQPPQVAILTLKNSKTNNFALVGKGVTFDSGGTNVKTGTDIGEMKMDMGGSAAVVGAIKLLADLNAPVQVTAILPLVTNVAGGNAFLPSDVITYRNGKTVEVGNTDAEGRLILADGILYAQTIGADTIIDIATLTGTIGQALGLKMAGIFSNNEKKLWNYKKLGERTGDYVWPMPVIDDYQLYLKSSTADINNMSSSSFGGAITAALFLKNFVEDHCHWVHIDMANTVRPWKIEGYYQEGAAGFGVRLLTEIVVQESKRP